MASTNSTTNYDLSQYIGTDKPTYLVDYNGDMAKIDAGINGAKVEADENKQNIGTMANLQTSEKSSLVGAVNEVNTQTVANTTNIGTNTGNITTLNGKVGDLTNLNTTNKLNLVGAINEVKGVADQINDFNIDTFVTHNASTTSISTGSFNYCELHEASNSDGSLGKVYGIVDVNLSGVSSGTNINVTFQSNLRPATNIVINELGITIYIGNGITSIYNLGIEISSTGLVKFTITSDGSNGVIRCILHPCLLFMKDFGDA